MDLTKYFLHEYKVIERAVRSRGQDFVFRHKEEDLEIRHLEGQEGDSLGSMFPGFRLDRATYCSILKPV